MVHRLPLPSRAFTAALIAALAAFIAATGIAADPAAAGGVAPGTMGSPTAPTGPTGPSLNPWPAGAPAPWADWRPCAREGLTCSTLLNVLDGTAAGDWEIRTTQIRYGQYFTAANFEASRTDNDGYGNWTIQTRAGNVPCTNAVFGDPFPGREKRCEIDASAEKWDYCTSENGTCDIGNNTKWVRYGASDPHAAGASLSPEAGWTVRMKSGSFKCTNREFDSDPHPGVVKACWVYW